MPAQPAQPAELWTAKDPEFTPGDDVSPPCHRAGHRHPLRAVVVLLLLLAPGLTSCTLAKPVIGIVVGPVRLLAESGGGCGSCSGESACAMVCVGSVVGAAAGLVTGVISDINWLCNRVPEPTANWQDPFATNER